MKTRHKDCEGNIREEGLGCPVINWEHFLEEAQGRQEVGEAWEKE